MLISAGVTVSGNSFNAQLFPKLLDGSVYREYCYCKIGRRSLI